MPAHVRKGDDVVITAGEFRGKTGTVLSVDPDGQRVVVKGPAIKGMVRTVKPTRINPKGGQVEVDRSFHISNVSPSVGGKPTRVRFETKSDGSKVRIAARGTLRPVGRADHAELRAAAGRDANLRAVALDLQRQPLGGWQAHPRAVRDQERRLEGPHRGPRRLAAQRGPLGQPGEGFRGRWQEAREVRGGFRSCQEDCPQEGSGFCQGLMNR